MACPIPSTRTYPLRKPPNHTLPVPRYTASFPPTTTHIHTIYIGLQNHSTSTNTAFHQAQLHISQYLQAHLHETFTLIGPSPDEAPSSKIWVAYHTNTDPPPQDLDLQALWNTLPSPLRSEIGLWTESFTTPLSRLETNYSGTDYLLGLARLPGINVAEHDLATYWGAARDRIPDSAHDLFPRSEDPGKAEAKESIGYILRGTNAHNAVHIRSGQWWAKCGVEETRAYEEKLEPVLRAGLQYLNENRGETGCMGVRYLRNVRNLTSSDNDGDDSALDGGGEGKERKETCGAGFFHNLEDLERWSKTHGSHLKIWRGALAHYKAFPRDRMLRTWHEVSVIREGDAKFEYVNCKAGTGVMGSVGLESERLLE